MFTRILIAISHYRMQNLKMMFYEKQMKKIVNEYQLHGYVIHETNDTKTYFHTFVSS